MTTTPEQPTELRVDPAVLHEAAEQLRQRPGPLNVVTLDPAAAGNVATAAAVKTFLGAYHAVAAALTGDDDAAATHLHDVAGHYRAHDGFRAHT